MKAHHQTYRPVKGYTLVSLLLAAAVISIGFIKMVNISQSDIVDSEIEVSAIKVSILHNAAIAYYDRHCSDVVFTQPTPTNLFTEGFLSSQEQINIPNASAPTITLVNVGASNISYRYIYNFESNDVATRVSNLNENSTVSGSSVTWIYTAHALSTDSLTYNHSVLSAFGANIC